MGLLSNTAYLIGYIGSNLFAIGLLIVAIKRSKLARLIFSLLFAYAFCMNYYYSHYHPTAYLEYAPSALPFYRDFINGWFKDHITAMVTLIAYGQAFIAIAVLLNNWRVKLACVGAIIFFIGIAPLGLYAAFPFSLTASAAAYFILRKDDLNFIWRFKKSHASAK